MAAMAHSENDVNELPHFTYIWTIENICFPFYAHSPTFTVKEMEMTKWYSTVYTNTSEFLNFYISRKEEDDGPESIEIKFELSVLGIDGLPLVEKVDVKMFSNGDFCEFDKFVDTHEVSSLRRTEFLPKDALTVRCRMWRIGTEISQIDSCFARTRLRSDRRFFVWAIRKFSTLQRDQVRKILLNTTPTHQLNFNLFVTENDGEEYLSIGTEECGEDMEWRNVKICLLDFQGKVVYSLEKIGYGIENFHFEEFFKKSRLMDDKVSLLPNDVLSLRFEVEMVATPVWSVIENYRYFNSMSSRLITTDAGDILRCEQDETSNVSYSFTEAMKSLIEEGILSDVSLRAGSNSLPAHKCILSARSPVFETMFSGDMKEKTSKCVEIPDVDEDTLRELLSYIYTDTVGELEWQGAVDLYRAADKYELLDLKKRCAMFLKSDLSVSNVCAVLSLADMHHDRELRDTAQDFVMDQKKEFLESDTWLSFKMGNSMLALDIVERILYNMKR